MFGCKSYKTPSYGWGFSTNDIDINGGEAMDGRGVRFTLCLRCTGSIAQNYYLEPMHLDICASRIQRVAPFFSLRIGQYYW